MSTRIAAAVLMLFMSIFAAASDDSTAFGPRIIDLALSISEPSRQSLRTAPDTDVPATMTARQAGVTSQYTVALHVKGQLGSARPVDDKPAFKIKLAPGERFLGLDHLTLNNMVQDPTMLHEALGYQVYAAAGVVVPRTSYVRLTVDDADLGLYLNVETIDSLFLERRFGNHAGFLYEAAYGVDFRTEDQSRFELHEGDDPGRQQLGVLIQAVQARGDGVFYGAAAQVDAPSFLSMMAAEALLADWDNYYAANNYRIYWNPSARRWFFIPTGIDQTFSSDATIPFGASGALFQKCLASDRCTADYVAAVRDAAVRFERLGLATRMDALLSVIGTASQADSRKPYDEAAVRTARDSMRAFIETQPGRVRDQIACAAGGDAALLACAGAVLVNESAGGCLEVIAHNAGQRASGARLAKCLGGAKQRWRLGVRGKAFQLETVTNGNCLDASAEPGENATQLRQGACSGSAPQLFTLRQGEGGAQIVVQGTGTCVGVAPGGSKTPAIVHATCSSDPLQVWRVQRSMFQ